MDFQISDYGWAHRQFLAKTLISVARPLKIMFILPLSSDQPSKTTTFAGWWLLYSGCTVLCLLSRHMDACHSHSAAVVDRIETWLYKKYIAGPVVILIRKSEERN